MAKTPTATQHEIIRAAVALATKSNVDHLLYVGDLPLPEETFRGKPRARKKLVQAVVGLSQREVDVLQGLADGLLYKEIAAKLGISYSAVHKYQHKLFEKLRVTNRSEAISVWLHATVDKSGETRVPNLL